MTARVVVRPGCCAAATDAADVVQALTAAGRKVVEVSDGPSVDDDDVRVALAGALGLSRGAVLAGCPVPFAAELGTWRQVRAELDADRWDVVLLSTGSAAAAVGLVGAPERLLRVLDARLDETVPEHGAAGLVEDLLALRREATELWSVVEAAVAAGACADPAAALVGLPLVDADDALGEVVPAQGVEVEGRGYRWWLRVGGPVEVHRVGDDVLEITSGTVRRGFRLPGALRRCDVQGATVRAGVLQVRFAPDADRWRWM